MITLIANPSSRSGRGRSLWPFWQQSLEATGRPWRLLQSASVPDCMDKAERAARALGTNENHCPPCNMRGNMPDAMPGLVPGGREGKDSDLDRAKGGERNIVAAVGGDGTINAVINGLMRAAISDSGPDSGANRDWGPTFEREAAAAAGAVRDRAAAPAAKRLAPGLDAALAVLYAGTSPDFCRFHGLPLDETKAMETLIAGEIRAVDIAALACTPAAEARSYFASSCNIGLGAATAAFANVWRRYLGDLPGTCLGLVRAMLGHRPFSCHLDLDDESLEFAGVNHVIILKNPHIASGLRANLPLKPDDGLLCAVVIHGYSRLGLLRLLRRFYKGDWLSLPGVFIRYCQKVALSATPAQAVECDGDPCGTTPVKANLLPKALLLVSPGSRRQGGGHA